MTSPTQAGPRILPKKLIAFVSESLNKWAALFVKLHVSPNALTLIALLLGFGAGILFATHQPLWAVLLIILCGIFDVLDGKVAVQAGQTSLFGAIFDSTLDRYSEFFIYLGLAYYFKDHFAIWIVFWTLLGSTMVSYTRARAEGLGIECKIGIMQRAERIILLGIGALIGTLFHVFDTVMALLLGIIALVSNVTALQRTFYVRKVEKIKNLPKDS